ncbi:hypothetical protein BS17DRAFT_768080 [Gyrodon lividus]|nr:hypothetical protein BS17DRAFT_768080 [Gyrodon lividus]
MTWLAQGLAIEESAIHVMKDKRSLKLTATEIQKLVVARRIDRLNSKISKFIDAAATYMASTIQDHDDTTPNESESEWEEIKQFCFTPKFAMHQISQQIPVLGERYKPLDNKDLKVTTAISDPNGSAHRMADLAWFWTMDIPRDAGESDWMSECSGRTWASKVRKGELWAMQYMQPVRLPYMPTSEINAI